MSETDPVAASRFRTRLRGYDPVEVDALISRLGGIVADLTAERDRLAIQVGELGAKDLKQEFESIGREVALVLEAAREAAESMRSRAAADASRWRSEAVAEAEAERRRARLDAEHLRSDAWTISEQLLEQCQVEAEKTRTESEKEAMRIIGEAEIASHRSQAAVRREAEDVIRAAKMEAEKLLVDAQARHDQLVEVAQKQAESSQERARSLEARRQELSKELEAVRAALNKAEGELDERRELLGLSPPSVAETPVADQWERGETVRVVRSGDPEEAREATVGPRPDRDEFVPMPEIRIISAAELAKRAAPPQARATLAETVPATVTVEEPEPSSDSQAEVGESAAEPSEPESSVAPEMESQPVTDEVDTEESSPGIDPDAGLRQGSFFDEVSNLFARLRDPIDENGELGQGSTIDMFEVRERRLLPVTNRLLRNLKRQLTDEANVALENLRINDGDWQADAAGLAERLRADLVVAAAEAFGAGHAAIEEIAGGHLTRPATPNTEPSVGFAEQLAEDLNHVIAEGRVLGQGPQQLGSAISRVFRTWRTDETERRLRAVALAAFNHGVFASLLSAVAEPVWVVSGRGCATCRAAAEAEIDLDHLPPAHVGCECVIAPR